MKDNILVTHNIREIAGGLTQARVQLIAVRSVIQEEFDEDAKKLPPEHSVQIRRQNQLTMLGAMLDGISRIRKEYGTQIGNGKSGKSKKAS